MKHFLNIQNGHIFALFLCVFTNFFLVLLIKKAFLRLLLCIFHNRQKKMQETDQTRLAAYEQRHACTLRTAYTDEHFSQQKAVFLQLPTSSHLASLQNPTSSGCQINSSRRQPASTSRRRSSFLTEQISAFRPPATSLSPTPVNFHPFRPPTFKHSASPFSINFPPKKTEPKAQFFPLYISSTFPGLCNP